MPRTAKEKDAPKKRGRPPKSANAAATAEVPKKRGRPPKAAGKKKVATTTKPPKAESKPKKKTTRTHKPQRWLVIMNKANKDGLPIRKVLDSEYPNLRAAKKAVKDQSMDGIASVLFAQVKGEFAFEQQMELVPVTEA